MRARTKSGSKAFWWKKDRSERGKVRAEKIKGRKKKSRVTSKRQKFLLSSFFLTLCLFVIQRLPVEARYGAIGLLALFSYVLSAWGLRNDLVGVGWITDLIMPTLYPIAVALFYFLLPQQAVVRMVILGIFLISMYALLLTANIFAVASNRTIQLLRAARTVGYLLSIVTAALLYHVLFSLNLSMLLLVGLSLVVTIPIYLQGVWMYSLSSKLSRIEWLPTLVGSLVTMEVSMGLSFWLIEPVMASVLMAMVVYVILGLFQHELDKRLFSKTLQEYVGFALMVFLIVSVAVIIRWAA